MSNGAGVTSDSDCRFSLFCHLLLALSRYQNNAVNTIRKTQYQSIWPWASTAPTVGGVCGIILYFAPCVCFVNTPWTVGKTSISNVSSYSSGSTSHHENKRAVEELGTAVLCQYPYTVQKYSLLYCDPLLCVIMNESIIKSALDLMLC